MTTFAELPVNSAVFDQYGVQIGTVLKQTDAETAIQFFDDPTMTFLQGRWRTYETFRRLHNRQLVVCRRPLVSRRFVEGARHAVS